ncbi:MAG: hypothetical protein L6Q83_08745 [Gammaproteobacteria bacterium]|nr:hypothetical protein [Gammaproteobacteria bacterium]
MDYESLSRAIAAKRLRDHHALCNTAAWLALPASAYCEKFTQIHPYG